MASFFAQESCDPFTAPDAPCAVGAYVQYAVRATSASDYQLTLAFAAAKNIRLVIRNTGHDYLGKSTGAGALALWTQALKDISIFDYNSATYKGKAMKVAAGVQADEAQAAAHAQGLVVVSGDCPSIGIAGGYTQGGGTSPLGSTFGLGADQVLEWEVVTANGQLLKATPTSNSDLYWALSGGGPGTYGAVLSMTVKAHPDVKVAGGSLIFSSQGVDQDAFWGVVKTVLMSLPNFVDAGGVALWMMVDGIFFMPQLFLPKRSVDDLRTLLLTPVINALNQAGIQYSKCPEEGPGAQGVDVTIC
jgi:FAD/FMN-containing dehydrogenase